MPAKLSLTTSTVDIKAAELGAQIRNCRKKLGVSVVAAAQTAGMSRVTWHRIEKGVTSVTAGAVLSALAVLGLDVYIAPSESGGQGYPSENNTAIDNAQFVPVRVVLAEYPQLKQLAWQVQGVDALSPQEVFAIYERNWRHMDLAALDEHERNLVAALRCIFGDASDV